MKRYVRASTEALPKSKYFELYEDSGVGINGQPWRNYRVRSLGAAEEQVVEVRLKYWLNFYRGDDEDEYSKEVVPEKYNGCYISWGMKGRTSTDEDVREMIDVLQDALAFEDQLRRFFDFD